jgi:excisionase family DNA binding protein
VIGMVSSAMAVESDTVRHRLLNIEQAADYLNASVRFVRDRRRDGHIRAVKLGGLLRFDPNDLDAYIESCREPSDAGTFAELTAQP